MAGGAGEEPERPQQLARLAGIRCILEIGEQWVVSLGIVGARGATQKITTQERFASVLALAFLSFCFELQ